MISEIIAFADKFPLYTSGLLKWTGQLKIGEADHRSLVARAQDNTLFFPMVISKELSYEAAQIITKSLELKIAQDIAVMLSTYDVIKMERYGSKAAFLRSLKGSDSILDVLKQGNINEANAETELKKYFSKAIINNNLTLEDKYELSTLEGEKLEEAFLNFGKGVTTSTAVTGDSYPDYAPLRNVKVYKDDNEKRINNLEGTMVDVEMIYKPEGSAKMEKTRLVFTVKTIAHYYDSARMLDALLEYFASGTMLTNFIRWTTGELSLFKDLLINSKAMQRMAVGAGSRERQLVAQWRHRAANSKGINPILRQGIGFIPNTTMIMSANEADYLKERVRKDLRIDRIAQTVIKDLALMGLLVVDELADVMTVIYDGQKRSLASVSGVRKNQSADEVLRLVLSGSRR